MACLNPLHPKIWLFCNVLGYSAPGELAAPSCIAETKKTLPISNASSSMPSDWLKLTRVHSLSYTHSGRRRGRKLTKAERAPAHLFTSP